MACIHLEEIRKEDWMLYECDKKLVDFPNNYRQIKGEYEELYPGRIAPPNNDCPFAYQGLEICKSCPLYEKRG